MGVAFTPICVGAAISIPHVLVHRARDWAVPVLSLTSLGHSSSSVKNPALAVGGCVLLAKCTDRKAVVGGSCHSWNCFLLKPHFDLVLFSVLNHTALTCTSC